MKKTQEILGLPIISISDGVEAGRVKGIIINSDKGAIDYFVIDAGIQVFGARVMPAEAVLGIGEYALTIENENTITDIDKVPEAIDFLQKEVRVSGTGVLTKKGRLIGEIGDIYIDEDNNCMISALEFKGDITQNIIKLIPRESVITFGKKLTVVNEDVEASLLDSPAQLSSTVADMIFGGRSFDVAQNEDTSIGDALISQSEEAIFKDVDEYVEAETSEDNDGSAAILFEQRQRQYLMGRKATRTITDSSGNVIIDEGAIIDDKIIDDAKGKGKLIELVMNNRA